MDRDTREENRYIKAKERVRQLRRFYGKLIAYIVGISLLGALNYWVDGWRYMWFLWAALGWGIGIVFSAIRTFDLNPFFGKDWEERKIKEYIEKDKEQQKWR